MAHHVPLDRAGAAPLRRAPSDCVLVLAGGSVPGRLRDVTGAGATFQTAARPAIGTMVSLAQPQAGTIPAEVVAHTRTGLQLAFARDEQALGFALAVLLAGLA